jgi:cytochrome c-type biogenesis protein CcmH
VKRSDLRWILLIAGCVLIASFTTTIALADDPATEAELQVERQLGCPICTNLPLNVCDNSICQQMKGVIREKLAAGQTPDQVVAFFVSRYGDGVLLTPPQQGFSLAVWYFPVVAVLLGGCLVWVFVRASLRRQEQIDHRRRDPEPDLDGYRDAVRRDVARSGEEL